MLTVTGILVNLYGSPLGAAYCEARTRTRSVGCWLGRLDVSWGGCTLIGVGWRTLAPPTDPDI